MNIDRLVDLSFFEQHECTESKLDGVTVEIAAEVGERLLRVRGAIRRGGITADRVERRMALVLRHAANAWAHLQLEGLRIERQAKAAADKQVAAAAKRKAGKRNAAQVAAEAQKAVAADMAEVQLGWKQRLERLSGTISAPLSLNDAPGPMRDLNVCGSARDDCYNQSCEVKSTARHTYGDHADVRRRTRSACLIQLSYQVMLRYGKG